MLPTWRKQGASVKYLACPSLMRAVCVRGKHFNGRQQGGLNKLNLNISTAG